MCHNVTPDLAKSSRKVRARVHEGFHHLQMLATSKDNGVTVKIAGLRSVSAVRDGAATGQSTLHRRDRREWILPRGLRAFAVGSEFRGLVAELPSNLARGLSGRRDFGPLMGGGTLSTHSTHSTLTTRATIRFYAVII